MVEERNDGVKEGRKQRGLRGKSTKGKQKGTVEDEKVSPEEVANMEG